jgi:DNA-binding LytR/AlgR family response regulator
MRLLYWVPLMLAGTVLGLLAGEAISRQPRIGDNPVAAWAAITTAITVPATVAVWAVTGLMFGRGLNAAALPYFAGAVLPVSAAMTAIMMLVTRPGAPTHAPPAGAAPATVRFAQRLPAKILGGAIWAVSAEDHYLRVHTSRGDDLVLMRLADAMAELEGLEGAQVHRSWWVARDGVAEVKRDGARVTLALKNGATAPVSRANVKALRDAGWF